MNIEHGKKYLFWDGDCGVCARSVEFARRIHCSDFVFAPYQACGVDALNAVGLTPDRCAHELKVVAENGRVYGGAFAVNYFLWHNGAWRILVAVLYALPFLVLAEVLLYRAIAANRATLSKVLGVASCSLHHSTTKEN